MMPVLILPKQLRTLLRFPTVCGSFTRAARNIRVPRAFRPRPMAGHSVQNSLGARKQGIDEFG